MGAQNLYYVSKFLPNVVFSVLNFVLWNNIFRQHKRYQTGSNLWGPLQFAFASPPLSEYVFVYVHSTGCPRPSASACPSQYVSSLRCVYRFVFSEAN